MHSTNVRHVKVAGVPQAFHDTTQVRCRLPASDRGQSVEGAIAGDDPGLEALVPRGRCQPWLEVAPDLDQRERCERAD
jgi:hypothetical protein